LRVQGAGKRFRGNHLLVMVAWQAFGPRIGYTVSRRVGNAVVRNLVRRRLKEVVRTAASELPVSADYVIIAFPSAAQRTFAELREELLCLLSRIAKRPPGPAASPAVCPPSSPSTASC
jgi:ribonuclease P protein component